MTCTEFDKVFLDAARGALDAVNEAAARRHAAGCASCAARLRRQEMLTGALRALAAEARDDAPDDGMGERLTRAFATVPLQRRRLRMVRWAAVAAVVLATTAVAGWMTFGRRGSAPEAAGGTPVLRSEAVAQARPPGAAAVDAAATANVAAPTPARPGRRPVGARRDSTMAQFVAWPGASALPPFESGQLVRTELPASVVPLLGLGTSGERRGRVAAEVIVAQDGLPRAVRLVR